MSVPTPSIIDTRRPQIFPVLEPREVERSRRFGEVCSYGPGEAPIKVGAVGRGLTVVLAGKVDVTKHDESGSRALIVTLVPGEFMGELATLAARPALVNGEHGDPNHGVPVAQSDCLRTDSKSNAG
jgi:thioredoxin reductase (NADPH)